MLALIMPHPEGQRRPHQLEQYAENFFAPSEKRREALLLLNELKNFEIVTPTAPIEHLHDGHVSFQFGLQNEMTLQLRIWEAPLPRYNYVNGNMSQMEQITEWMSFKQGIKMPSRKDINAWNHAQSMYVLAANVELMDAIFTNAKKGKPARRPLWFIENDVPHPYAEKNIRTDFVMVGSDNRFRMFEHGNSTDKPTHIFHQAGGLRILYRDKTKSFLPDDRILTYVTQYEVTPDEIALDIHPVDKFGSPIPRKERPAEQIIFSAAD